MLNASHAKATGLPVMDSRSPWKASPMICVEPHNGHGVPDTNSIGHTGIRGMRYSATKYANAKYEEVIVARAPSHTKVLVSVEFMTYL